MSFSIRCTTNSDNLTNSVEKKTDINLAPAKILNKNERFIYHPLQTMKVKSADEYFTDVYPNLKIDKHPSTTSQFEFKPAQDKEEIVFDKITNKWILVKDSEIYKYS